MQMSDSAMVTAMVTLQLSLEQRSDEEALEGLRMKKGELQESHNKLRDDRYVPSNYDGLVNCACAHMLWFVYWNFWLLCNCISIVTAGVCLCVPET